MKLGFNFGQIHHAIQLDYQNNGFATPELVKRIKDNTPHEMLKNARFSGTMSNTMLINRPNGYNHRLHDQKLTNQKKKLPTLSYLYAFVQLYKDIGCKSLSFTINTHEPFTTGKQEDFKAMLDSFDFIAANCNITAIELENESYLSCAVCGSAGGTPNLAKYLAGKPFIEVQGLMLMIQQLKPIEEKKD